VRLGEDLSLTGEHLAGGGALSVVFRGPLASGPFVLVPPALTVADGEIVATLPGNTSPSTWPAGIYTAQVIASRPGEQDRSSGELPFPLAPRITLTSPSPIAGPNVTLGVSCVPDVWPDQRVSLLLGDIEVPAPDPPFPVKLPTPQHSSVLTFTVTGLVPGTYVVRLRVDGVDSIPIDLTVSPLQFAADQTVVIS
jgi:hypothetical protein